MTIHLPASLESSILDAVHSGRYASLDDAMADAASLLIQRLRQEQAMSPRPAVSQEPTTANDQRIWEVLDELRKSVPPQEFSKLPKDGAEQLDHYIYGSPKRPTA